MRRTLFYRGSGFTLIEMIISLTLMAIVIAAITGVFLQFSRALTKQQDAAFLRKETEAAFMQLNRTVPESFGWINGDSLGITLINDTGDSLKVSWSSVESMLTAGGKGLYPEGVKMTFCRFYYMPKTMAAMSMPPEQWLQEVDLDRNGKIEGGELAKVSLLVIKFKVTKGRAEYEASKNVKLPPAITNVTING
jgi:prepilin-type N-terminal cleavage/methylation domain-containing protein